MNQTIEITMVTMKRLLNYQRVIDRQADTANRHRWQSMTTENMRRYECASQKARHLDAIVAYAGFLFRVQNNLISYTALHGEYLLHNGLVELMKELDIPIEIVAVEDVIDVAPPKGAGEKR
jgi:hypothetical protein